jgi:hypothetical protein
MIKNRLGFRIGEIVRLRYVGTAEGHIPIENALGDLLTIAFSQYAVWTVTEPWLGQQYFAKASLSVAALTICLYNILWLVTTKAQAFRELKLGEKWLEALVRATSVGSILVASWCLGKNNTYAFLIALMASFCAVVIWNFLVPRRLRDERGLFFYDICMFIAGVLFCLFSWQLYEATAIYTQTLSAAAAQLNPLTHEQNKNKMIVEQMGPIIYLACSTTAMLMLLCGALLSGPRREAELAAVAPKGEGQ